LWNLLNKEARDRETEFDLNWMLVSAAGYEVTKNGRGYVMRNRAVGDYRWQSCLKPFYYLQDMLALVKRRFPDLSIELYLHPKYSEAALHAPGIRFFPIYRAPTDYHALAKCFVQKLMNEQSNLIYTQSDEPARAARPRSKSQRGYQADL
jgi:hypothetical protein